MKRKIYFFVVFAAFIAFGTWYFVNFHDIMNRHKSGDEGDIASNEKNISDNGKYSIDKNPISSENNKEGTYADERIDLNTADEAELSSLEGIGAKKAGDIIDYRNKNGGFKSIEDIMNISGIGESTFNNIKNDIKV